MHLLYLGSFKLVKSHEFLRFEDLSKVFLCMERKGAIRTAQRFLRWEKTVSSVGKGHVWRRVQSSGHETTCNLRHDPWRVICRRLVTRPMNDSDSTLIAFCSLPSSGHVFFSCGLLSWEKLARFCLLLQCFQQCIRFLANSSVEEEEEKTPEHSSFSKWNLNKNVHSSYLGRVNIEISKLVVST